MKSESVIIIGGGIVGCTAAYFLAEQGYRVQVLEKNEIASGSSGRNPGYLLVHNRNTGTALNLAKEGMKIYRELVEKIGDCFEFKQNGSLTYFYNENQKQVAKEFVQKRQSENIEIELLNQKEVHKLEPDLPADILGAVYTPLDGQINTPLFVKQLAKVASEQYKVDIVTQTKVNGLITNGNKVLGVKTNKGDYYSDTVVLATGAWSSILGEKMGLELPVYQERLQVMETEAAPVTLNRIVYGPSAIKHYGLIKKCPSFKEEYFQIPEESKYGQDLIELVCQRQNGNLLIGCPSDYPGLSSQNATMDGIQLMIENFKNQFPALKALPINDIWGGWLPFTTDGLPIIDKVDSFEGLIVGVGHIFGNTAGPATGKLITEMIEGKELSVNIKDCNYGRYFPSAKEATW